MQDPYLEPEPAPSDGVPVNPPTHSNASPDANSGPDSAADLNLRNFLLGRIDYEKSAPADPAALKFQTLLEMLNQLGNPHLTFPSIHIAGTKGKGSVTAITASILRAAGLKVATYSSPHLIGIEERIQLDGTPIAACQFDDLLRQVQPVVESIDLQCPSQPDLHRPTFFEITTCLALLFFAQQRVDCAVVEVGLGGRLDSTNVIQSDVAVINSIGLDHTHILGDTLEQIAGEKAGIIKPQTAVVCGALPPEAQAVVDAIAVERRCPMWRLGQEIQLGRAEPVNRADSHELYPAFVTRTGQDCDTNACQPNALNDTDHSLLHQHRAAISLDRFAYEYAGMKSAMAGWHQAQNAATAIAAANLFWQLRGHGQEPIDEHAVRRGVGRANLPGRFQWLNNGLKQDGQQEQLSTSSHLLLDIAHNVNSCQALATTLKQCPEFRSAASRVLVFASSRDKDQAGMLRWLVPLFEKVILTRYTHNPRAADPQLALAGCPELAANVEVIERLDAILPRIWEHFQSLPKPVGDDGADAAQARPVVCVTGSVFIVGEVLESWVEENKQ